MLVFIFVLILDLLLINAPERDDMNIGTALNSVVSNIL